jgi:integrase
MSNDMTDQFRIFRRASGRWYIENTTTRRQESLQTCDATEAKRLLLAKNEAHRQPTINLQIARAYLSAADPAALLRTWKFAMDEMAKGKHGPTKARWLSGIAQKPFDRIRHLKLIETRSEHLWSVLTEGTVSTNVFLRRIHNFALDMNWLLAPLIPRRQWPTVHYRPKRAITLEEHQKILAGERNSQLRAYYQLLWHLGGSQTDVATLSAQDIDWANHTIAFSRSKSGTPVVISFGEAVTRILEACPRQGYLLPMVANWNESDRGSIFSRRCRLVGVKGVSLHSYRYAWAERAKTAGFPERFAQEALGHKSQAVHRAYAKKAQVRVPCLEDWERQMKDKVVRLAFQNDDESRKNREPDHSRPPLSDPSASLIGAL